MVPHPRNPRVQQALWMLLKLHQSPKRRTFQVKAPLHRCHVNLTFLLLVVVVIIPVRCHRHLGLRVLMMEPRHHRHPTFPHPWMRKQGIQRVAEEPRRSRRIRPRNVPQTIFPPWEVQGGSARVVTPKQRHWCARCGRTKRKSPLPPPCLRSPLQSLLQRPDRSNPIHHRFPCMIWTISPCLLLLLVQARGKQRRMRRKQYR
mmetsp:Transcript_28931/g.67160  ORF Transcript_28931/g.67160 Transcript_28931/m.67160 type:complete len:202 (+) Transcript_28931:625-1230(+)